MAYAGFWRRLVALIVDNIVMSIAFGVVGGVLGFIVGFTGVGFDRTAQAPTTATMVLAYFLFFIGWWLYFALMESSSNQATLGKMALGIKVTDLEGRQISFAQATGRNFGKLVSILIIYIGFIMAAFTAKKQALHDIMAGTLVVKK